MRSLENNLQTEIRKKLDEKWTRIHCNSRGRARGLKVIRVNHLDISSKTYIWFSICNKVVRHYCSYLPSLGSANC
ncbi:hypothetical protein Mapa_009738 [Marchantia paleacea]|nr:hypothetical protein Mapa_009738 [Marchantia paleacea]